jgi:3-oxoacyl-[acyl-carrier protein] reductase
VVDLGLTGSKAIVCGASSGLGFACAQSLAREGVAVLIVARSAERVDSAVARLRGSGGDAEGVVADLSTEAGRENVLRACTAPDILINNAGGPPAGDFRDWAREDWIKALDLNMLSAIFMMRGVIDGMIERSFGRIVNITSMAVKAPIGVLGLSNGARSGLTGFVAGLARETVAHDVTINNLLPGMFMTDRLRATINHWASVEQESVSVTEERRRGAIPAQRFGHPAEFGEICAFLCSRQASYVTGANLLVDGGLYPGTF